MNASAIGRPASAPHGRDPAPGLDGVARGAEQRAELARAGIEVGDRHRHAPHRGPVALHLDDLEDQRPEVDEGLPDVRLGRHADAAHLEPGLLERGERAPQVVRERHDVVDDRRAVGAPRAGGPAIGGHDLEAVGALGGQAVDGELERRRAHRHRDLADRRAGREAQARPGLGFTGQGERAGDGHEDECDRPGVRHH